MRFIRPIRRGRPAIGRARTSRSQWSRRRDIDRLNIHGAINLETGQTQILAVEKVNALSFIKLLGEIEDTHTAMRLIHVFVDNAAYHKAEVVKEWLAAAGRRIVLRFLPPYCPHLDPIERLWGLMHENVTHNRDYKTFAEFRREVIQFFRHTVPRNEYASKLDGVTVTVNGPENYFSIFKRGVYGTYHAISEAHLHRYLAEFEFRYNNRSKLGVEDTERVAKIAADVGGKRLTYRAADRSENI
jgi:hypothetical protein